MEASSRAALAAVRERLAERTRGGDGEALLFLADELFSVGRLLTGQPSLRRALSDPAAGADDRAGLARRLLANRLSPAAVDIVEAVVRQRWSRPLDLVDAMEELGRDSALGAAEARGELDGVEDELFRFGRIVAGDPALSRVLGDRAAPAAGKTALLDELLGSRVSPVTRLLLRTRLTSPAVGTPEVAIERLSEAASARRGRSVAHVTAAAPLSAEQERRLADVLGRVYGRTIGVQVTVEPSLLGGLVIRVGDEVIDGSIAHRLETAGRRLGG
jgi:F-type H+-transporting ATPase subunit delta